MDRVTGFTLSIEKIDRDEDMYPERVNHTIVDARYAERAGITDIPDICALPHPATAEHLIGLGSIPIKYYNCDTAGKGTVYERIERVLLMQSVYAPLAHNFEMQKAVDDALMTSYLSRSLWIKNEYANDETQNVYGMSTQVITRHTGLNSRPMSFSFSGVTGCGKTVSINLITSRYPEAIHHVVDNVEYIQIPIITVTALVGNMSELFLAIGKKIDAIMGQGPIWENQLRKVRHNNGMAASVIKDAIELFHIGLIVVDEAQFLKFDGSNASLEHLIGISEETHCALGFIGNREMSDKMKKYPRFEGRVMLNSKDISSTDENDKKFFENAINFLWQYQFTKVRTELTEEIRVELRKDSMYNIAILKALLMRVQHEAVLKYPKSGITAEYIHGISEKHFSTIQAMLFDASTNNELKFYECLKKNTDEIQTSVTSLSAKANLQAIEEQNQSVSVWGEKYHSILFCVSAMHDISDIHTKRALNSLLKNDPNLPQKDIAYIVDQVKRYVNSNVEAKRSKHIVPPKKKRTVDSQNEGFVHNAMRSPLQDIAAGSLSG